MRHVRALSLSFSYKNAFVHKPRLSRSKCSPSYEYGIVETEICTYIYVCAATRRWHSRAWKYESFSTAQTHTGRCAVIVFTVFWAYFEYRFSVSRHASTVSQFICKIISRGNTCSKGMDGHKKLHYHIVTRKFVCKNVRTRYRAYR